MFFHYNFNKKNYYNWTLILWVILLKTLEKKKNWIKHFKYKLMIKIIVINFTINKTRV